MQKSTNRIKNIIIFSGIALLALILLKETLTDRRDDLSPQSFEEGKQLATQYCQSCHQLPDPSLLDKQTWKSLLPEMGLYLGIHSPGVNVLAEQDRGFYPTEPAMDKNQWKKILAYYDSASPLSLPLPQKQKELISKNSFAVLTAPDFLIRQNIMASLVKVDSSVQPARLFVFDAIASVLFLFNQEGFLDSIRTDGTIVDINITKNEILACSIGNQLKMGPDNEKLGAIIPIKISSTGKLSVQPPLFNNLARPVQVVPADINGDRRKDYLICEFGKLTGSLTAMINTGNGRFDKQLIRNLPGSVKLYVDDPGNTGLPDLWVLFAQGNEGIFHFNNQGNGTFKERQVLQFPSAYGSTSFEWTDLNSDGLRDIVYSCGDNGDGTRILKPYHGVYVFMNNGKDQFEQKYFYPMNGCYKVLARDFENRGVTDLAAIAYFTDPAHPDEWFVYLRNDGADTFIPYGPPPGTGFSSALTMDAGDFNGDRKPDLLVGSEFFSTQPQKKGSLFAILESTNGGN